MYANGRAYTKPCGDWSEDLSNTGRNDVMPNHGCAVQANIAAMLADPKDVVTPNKTTPAHSAVGVAAIRKQQTGQSQTGFGSLFSIF
jgi:pilus assembly protein CpaD